MRGGRGTIFEEYIGPALSLRSIGEFEEQRDRSLDAARSFLEAVVGLLEEAGDEGEFAKLQPLLSRIGTERGHVLVELTGPRPSVHPL